MTCALCSVVFRQIIKTTPTFAIFYVVKLVVYFLLGMASSFNNFPETDELIERDLSIVIYINSVEQFSSRNLAESALPMVYGLVLVDRVASIDVKDPEHILHVL